MKIEKLERLKSGKYKIYFENQEKIITYDDVILKNNLLFHKEVDDIVFAQIQKDAEYYDLYNKTLKYIEKKMRSEKEINVYLNEYEENIKSSIIEKLKQIGLINDQNYIKAYISDRIHLNNEGINKIKQDLLNQNIEENLIDNEISKIDSEIIKQNLKKLILKKINSNTKYSNYILKQKIMSDLISKGYDFENINEIIDNYIKNDFNIIEKEYIKLYKKLSKKYTEKDLYYNIKSKLYQKGFNKDEIEKYLENMQ